MADRVKEIEWKRWSGISENEKKRFKNRDCLGEENKRSCMRGIL